MDKQHFDQLVKGVREMKRHLAGKPVRGAKFTDDSVPSVRKVREGAQVSQGQYAKLIGVNLRTLLNWEQERTKPAGPARAIQDRGIGSEGAGSVARMMRMKSQCEPGPFC